MEKKKKFPTTVKQGMVSDFQSYAPKDKSKDTTDSSPATANCL